MSLTDLVKQKALELGADLVGIAPVERFSGAPYRMSPQGLLPVARSVIVAAMHHLDAAVELGGEPTPHDMGPYGSQSAAMNPKLDDLSFRLARFLEDRGYTTLPIAASNIWRYHGYKDLKVDFAPDLAHRYAAVAAGLGEIGWSGLCLTPSFGPRQRFVSVITEAQLDPSPMYDGETLCDKCMECVKHCPTDAFRKEVGGINRLEIGGKRCEFPNTNKWRCAWAENFGLSLSHEIPDRIDERVIVEYQERYGWRGGEEGCCLKFCMTPAKRCYDASYCRAPRRKKEARGTSAVELLEAIQRIVAASHTDAMAVGRAEDFTHDHAVHPRYHLPDAVSVISLATSLPLEGGHDSDVANALRRLLSYAAFDVAHHLDIHGYSAVTGTRIGDVLVARKLGTYSRDALVGTVLTSAPLPVIMYRRKPDTRPLGAEDLRDYCRQLGADLVGFFTTERFGEFRREIDESGLIPETIAVVNDSASHPYGPFTPETLERVGQLKAPQDCLPGAMSVIVLGLHFPDASLDTAKITPAETTGPFAFAQYETVSLLRDMACAVVRRLNDAGYRATFTSDLTGLASQVTNSRGMLPDMRANLYAAVLAGIAYPGVHGHPLTAEYGTRQRFIAVVTECPLPSDPLYDGAIACEACDRLCMAACPMAAISGEHVALSLEGKAFAFPRIDGYACDWAKRYGLSGKEGPAYWGLDVERPLPAVHNAEALATAVSAVEWGVQKRHLNVAEECLRVCPARGGRAA